MRFTIQHVVCLATICIVWTFCPAAASAVTRIVEVTASQHQEGNPPEHALDHLRDSRWAANGKGQWLQINLNQATELARIKLGFSRGTRRYAFDLAVSSTGKTWTTVGSFTSGGKGDQVELFRFEKQPCKALRIISQGNNDNAWINLHTLELPDVRLDESILAKLPKQKQSNTSLEFTKWSGDINVPDPVAISFDNQGRAYVTQTQRRKAQDLDIRAHADWITDDLRLQSVGQKRAFYHRVLAPRQQGEQQQALILDRNGDGSSDYHDLTVISERIHLLADRDRDGTADQISLFADGFQTEVTGIAAGVLWYNGDVYATIAPDVWRLRDRDGDERADERELVATGFGLHIAYGGHDMHGLTVGPDGKIYWSIGDKGISVTTKDGRRFHYPNQGGVMRCNPDGSDFEVFAHGLRNVQELAFDQHGNLFGVDNDSDRPGEKERFVYIVEGMDAGWRCNYQYRKNAYNPWMDEQLWIPQFAGQAAYIVPPIRHSINGPAGFTFNPGTALGPDYHNYFFLTGAPGGEQIAFQVQPVGASFKMVNDHPIGRGVPLVGINFAPDGALYGVDWGGGYPLNQKGAVWKIDDPRFAGSPARQEVQQRLSQGFSNTTVAKLGGLLKHADQRIRCGAQFELVRRREFGQLASVAGSGSQTVARLHAIWGLGQLARAGSAEARQALADRLTDKETEVRAQAAKTCGDLPEFEAGPLVPLLADEPRVAFQAAIGLGKHPVDAALTPIVAMIQAYPATDTYMRHAAVMALAGSVPAERLTRLKDHVSEQVRSCAVVALRRQQAAGVQHFLADRSRHVAAEAARAIYDDFSIPAALPALASRLAEMTSTDEALVRRAIGANYRLGTTENALRLAQYAANEAAPSAMRLEALQALTAWHTAAPLDRVTGRYRESKLVDRSLDVARLRPLLAKVLLGESSQLQAASLIATRGLKIDIADDVLVKFLESDAADTLRIEALNSLATQSSEFLPAAIDLVIETGDTALRIRGVELLVETRKAASLDRLIAAWEAARSVRERQRFVSLLATVGSAAADRKLLEIFAALPPDVAPPESLEVLEAMQARVKQSEPIRAALDGLQQKRLKAVAKDPLALYRECLDGGDARRGKSVFNTHLQAQCVRCHRVGKSGSTVGPALADVAKRRDRQFLLRSIVLPSADIDEKYRSQLLILDSGKTVQGLRLREEAGAIVLADAQGKEVRIPLDTIDEAIEQKASIMPEMTKTLTKREIRDLVAYLATLKAAK